jgi:dipeptidyl aminopeptidase/acylaminoacyl peptidase
MDNRPGDVLGVSRRPRWRRRLAILAVIVVALLAVAYLGAGAYVYDQLTVVPARCGDDAARLANNPTSFHMKVGDTSAEVDTAPYFMPQPETVSFPARDDAKITIAAWWVPGGAGSAAGSSADEAARPAVIFVHGHQSCRHEPEVLLAGGMLHRAGFSVLFIDLRDQGDSTVVDGRYAGGTNEYFDVLGAFDWLRAKGIPAARIGVAGQSLGAATAMIAAGEEPGLAAVWEDSGFGDIRKMVRDELEFRGFPALLEPAAMLMGRVMSGVDIAARSPLLEVKKLDGRPIYITHGGADAHISADFAGQLADAVRADGGSVEPWIIAAAGHTRAITIETAEYDRRSVAFFTEALGAP